MKSNELSRISIKVFLECLPSIYCLFARLKSAGCKTRGGCIGGWGRNRKALFYIAQKRFNPNLETPSADFCHNYEHMSHSRESKEPGLRSLPRGKRCSHPGFFEVGHALARQGEKPATYETLDEHYDLVVVGAGMSGLAAA